jgi:transcriptional regulator with XRE-family HTH domain
MYMFDMKLIGKRLKTARKDMNYSQQDAADFLGKSREQISYYENGSRQINLSLLNKLSNMYGKSINYFIGEESVEPKLKIAFRSKDISKKDLEKIEWAKNFVNNLYELKHL